MKQIFFCILIAISFQGIALSKTNKENCKFVRLDAPGGPLEKYPMKHQDGLEICDHYAACVIINAKKFYQQGREAFKNDCSPIAIAGILTPKINGTRFEQLSIEQILANVSKIGSCNDDIVLNKFASNSNQNFCEELKFAFNLLKPNPEGTAAASPASNEKKKFCEIKLTPSRQYDGLSIISKFLKTTEDLNAVASSLESVCQNHTQPVTIGAITRAKAWELPLPQRHSELKNEIDKGLDAIQPMPVAIKYCQHVLKDLDIVGVNPEYGKLDSKLCTRNGRHGHHVSAIIGREFNEKTQKCEYLVKNSEGTSCHEYDKRLRCDQTKGGNKCPPGTECGGQIWVPEEALFDNTSTVVRSE